MVTMGVMAAMTIKNIPPELFQKFKAYCALKGKNYHEVIMAFMEEKAKLVKLDPEKN